MIPFLLTLRVHPCLEDEAHLLLRSQLECATDAAWLERHVAFGAESLRIEVSRLCSTWVATSLDLPAIEQGARLADLTDFASRYVAALDIEQTAAVRLRAIADARPATLQLHQLPATLAPRTPGPSTLQQGITKLVTKLGGA